MVTDRAKNKMRNEWCLLTNGHFISSGSFPSAITGRIVARRMVARASCAIREGNFRLVVIMLVPHLLISP